MSAVLAWVAVGAVWSFWMVGSRVRGPVDPTTERHVYGALLLSLLAGPALMARLQPTQLQVWLWSQVDRSLIGAGLLAPGGSPGLMLPSGLRPDALMVGAAAVLLAGWAFGLARLMSGAVSLSLLKHRGRDVTQEVLGRAHQAGELAVALPAGVRILEHPRVGSPALGGSLRPVILVPPDWRRAPPGALRHMLLHEQAHHEQRDSLRRSLTAGLLAALWFNPLAWYFTRRYRSAQEDLADRAVLERGERPIDYAESVLYWSARRGGLRYAPSTVPMVGRRLPDRLEGILRSQPPAGAGVRGRPGFALAVLLACWLSMGALGGTYCPVSASAPDGASAQPAETLAP